MINPLLNSNNNTQMYIIIIGDEQWALLLQLVLANQNMS